MSEDSNVTTYKNVRKITVIPDLHLDDVFEGKHINYQQDTIDTMTLVLNYVIKEKPDLVVLVGDVIGVRPGRSRVKTRTYLAQIITFLENLAPNVIVLKGNHDISLDSDFDFLEKIKTIKTVREVGSEIDINPTGKQDDVLRLHLRDYGAEKASLNIKGSEAGTNIVIAHNDFYIAGQEYRRHSDSAIDLTKQTQWRKADMVLSGHIHTPSQELEQYHVLGDTTDDPHIFLNLGCPSRPSHAELYNASWIVTLSKSDTDAEGNWNSKFDFLELKDYHEVFTKESTIVSELTEQLETYTEEHNLDLQNTIDTLMQYGPQSRDIKEQIDTVISATPEARTKAKNFIDQARID